MLISFFVFLLPVIALLSLVLYLPLFFIRNRGGALPLLRHVAGYALLGYALSLVYLTILWYWPDISFTPEWYFLNLRPFVWLTQTYEMGVEKMIEQLLLNIGMFVPMGLLLPVNFSRLRALWKTAAATLAATLTIETLQYFMGRSADIDDVLTNLAGGVLGYLLYALLNRCFAQKRLWAQLNGTDCG